MSEDWWFEPQTITILDKPEERETLVLDHRGFPYTVKRGFKMGFDLSPRKKDE